MKNLFKHNFLLVIFLVSLVLPGISARAQEAKLHEQNTLSDAVVITATDYAFEAPKEIASGWTNIRFRNEGQQIHLLLFSRLPEGKNIDDYLTEAGIPYNKLWYLIRDGNATPKQMEAAMGEIPDWFEEVKFMGGAGLVMPGREAETTINLPPGYYVLECYAKTEDGEIHFMEGMARPILVNETSSKFSPPTEDIELTIENDKISVRGDLISGKQVVKVKVAEKPEKGLGHNVHLARLETGANLQEVVQWMDWFTPNGLRAPSPAQVTFIGGMHFLPLNSAGYFTVDFSPGRYLFISGPAAQQGVMKEITVK